MRQSGDFLPAIPTPSQRGGSFCKSSALNPPTIPCEMPISSRSRVLPTSRRRIRFVTQKGGADTGYKAERGREAGALPVHTAPGEEQAQVPALRISGPNASSLNAPEVPGAGSISWTLLYLISNHPSKGGSSEYISSPMGTHFGALQECLKELQQENIQLLHGGLSCIVKLVTAVS